MIEIKHPDEFKNVVGSICLQQGMKSYCEGRWYVLNTNFRKCSHVGGCIFPHTITWEEWEKSIEVRVEMNGNHNIGMIMDNEPTVHIFVHGEKNADLASSITKSLEDTLIPKFPDSKIIVVVYSEIKKENVNNCLAGGGYVW